MYSANNEGKSVVAKRFIRTLRTKICKYMNSVSKNMYNDKLNDRVNEYQNTYHRTTKVKPVDVKDNAYIDSDKEVDDKDPKFQVGDHVRISKYKHKNRCKNTAKSKPTKLLSTKSDWKKRKWTKCQMGRVW